MSVISVNLFPFGADFNLEKRKKSAGDKSNERKRIRKGVGDDQVFYNSIRGQELPYNQGGVWPGIIVEKSPGAMLRVLRAYAMDLLQ
ncbi:hypothetical protein TNCV_2108621 [Trichonephila clavipes]|nr:hypothetical protein TNCV_2108621 [Trichonephila clavipes]